MQCIVIRQFLSKSWNIKIVTKQLIKNGDLEENAKKIATHLVENNYKFCDGNTSDVVIIIPKNINAKKLIENKDAGKKPIDLLEKHNGNREAALKELIDKLKGVYVDPEKKPQSSFNDKSEKS